TDLSVCLSGKRRIEPFLNRSEQEFVASRRNTVLQTLKKLKIQCSRKEVPNIALLGSGGGQRAMVGLLGSLVQLDKAGLLDCILYLSGVSGSTWCMASLYQEPDWSTKLETVKDRIIERIRGPGVSLTDAMAKLKKYYYGKDFFSLTDVWAVMVITSYVKEIDEHALTEQRNQHKKDPFPIYTVIDKQCKQSNEQNPWFEINPYEAGYSLTGAFVDTCDFGSQFHEGTKKKHQDEFDMLYLQALCGSTLADEVDIKKTMWQKIKPCPPDSDKRGFPSDDPIPPSLDECYRALMDVVDMNISALNGEDTSGFDKSIRTNLNDLSGGKSQLIDPMKTLETVDKRAEKRYIKRFTIDVCEDLSSRIKIWLIDAGISICKCMAQWIWGRKYNFLHNMTDEAVHSTILQSETRDYIDAGLLLNSPYFSVLREERDIDLIISLDFSDGDPFMVGLAIIHIEFFTNPSQDVQNFNFIATL
uniref:Cytosolic phospholipase A2 delta-like n=1 Tax=Sinocyclocheilus rhinocerous TaxID=307959 RepID=A0A673GQA2_9TELE